MGASITQKYDNYYIASNRTYTSYDKYLKTGPYNFGWANTRPDWVEHFPYQNGLLISYWDTSQSDNNTSEHNGEGLILPIDSHPAPINRLDGQVWRNRIQLYDATFGTQKADSFTLHFNGQAELHPRAERPAAVRRHEVVLERQDAQQERQAARCGRDVEGGRGEGHLDEGAHRHQRRRPAGRRHALIR